MASYAAFKSVFLAIFGYDSLVLNAMHFSISYISFPGHVSILRSHGEQQQRTE